MGTLEIVKQVRAVLSEDPRIHLHSHPLRIDLEADGALLLEGELPSLAAKKIALSRAAAVPGIAGIVDRLLVTPSRRMTDGEIRDHVRDALLEEPALDQCGIRAEESGQLQMLREVPSGSRYRIDVAVNEGVVNLDGAVESLSQKRLTGALAWWVPGSRDVVNGLEVVPNQQDTDDEITEAVRLILEKDPLVNADHVRIHTRNAAVTLEGLVANSMESEMIESDAWSVIGVDSVLNRLEESR